MDNRRKQIIINQKFQQHYAVIIVGMTVFLTNIVIIFLSLFPGETPLELTTTEAWTIGIVELVLVIGAWYGSIKATHKIAGPVYTFTRELRAVAEGALDARISLRQGDMFQEEADSINASLEQLQSKINAVQSAAELLEQAKANGEDTAGRIEKLLAELSKLRARAGD